MIKIKSIERNVSAKENDKEAENSLKFVCACAKWLRIYKKIKKQTKLFWENGKYLIFWNNFGVNRLRFEAFRREIAQKWPQSHSHSHTNKHFEQ